MYQFELYWKGINMADTMITIAQWVMHREQLAIFDNLVFNNAKAIGKGEDLKFVDTYKGDEYTVILTMR